MPYTKPFKKLLKEFKKEYLGEKVPIEYQDRYGKMYNKKDIEVFAMATAKKKGIPIEEKPIKKRGLFFNNRGQTLGLAILSAIIILIVGFMFLNFLTPEIDDFRANMNCATPSAITDGTKLLCLVVDTTVFYWIILVMSVAIGGITARVLL